MICITLLPAYTDMIYDSTWMGDRLWAGKPSRHVTSHLGQLSLVIPPWVGVHGLRGEGRVWLIGVWYVSSLHRGQ